MQALNKTILSIRNYCSKPVQPSVMRFCVEGLFTTIEHTYAYTQLMVTCVRPLVFRLPNSLKGKRKSKDVFSYFEVSSGGLNKFDFSASIYCWKYWPLKVQTTNRWQYRYWLLRNIACSTRWKYVVVKFRYTYHVGVKFRSICFQKRFFIHVCMCFEQIEMFQS